MTKHETSGTPAPQAEETGTEPSPINAYKAENAKYGWTGRQFGMQGAHLSLGKDGDAMIFFKEEDLQYDESGPYIVLVASEVIELRDYLADAFPHVSLAATGDRVKLDGCELWEIVFGIANDAAHEITDVQYQQIAETINQVFIGDIDATTHTPAPQPQEVACCPICNEPFQPSDLCAHDITEGTCHATCLEGSPVVDMETEEEIPGGKATTYLYREVMEPDALAAKERAAE